MLFEQDGSGRKELKQKVLDMGLGMERIAWFSQGTVTMYDAVFPEAISFLKKKTRVVFDFELFKKFAPYASLLNLDEVEDIDSVWNFLLMVLNCLIRCTCCLNRMVLVVRN